MENGRKYLKLTGGVLLLAVLVGGLAFVFTRLRVAPEVGSSVAPAELYPAPAEPYPVPETATGTLSELSPAPERATDPAPDETPVLENSNLKIPPCIFPENTSMSTSDPEPLEADLDQFGFSAPEIIPMVNDIELVQWIPDSRWFLIIENLPGGNTQRVQLFNPETTETQIFIERKGILDAMWLPQLNAVAYTTNEAGAISHEINGELWISQGEETIPHQLAIGLSSLYLGIEPETDILAYVSEDTLNLQDRDFTISSIVQVPSWQNKPTYLAGYEMAWRPGTHQLILYNDARMLLVDNNTKQICEVSIGNRSGYWAGIALWSPNGRYLAMI